MSDGFVLPHTPPDPAPWKCLRCGHSWRGNARTRVDGRRPSACPKCFTHEWWRLPMTPEQRRERIREGVRRRVARSTVPSGAAAIASQGPPRDAQGAKDADPGRPPKGGI